MLRCLVLPIVLLAPSLVIAQSAPGTSSNDTSARVLLGAQLTPVPALLRSHLSQIPKEYGLIVEAVETDSVAERIGLQTHDILLRFHDTSIRDAKHLAGLISVTPPRQDRRVHILRAGKVVAFTCAFEPQELPHIAKSSAKAQGPPAVRLEAERLEAGKLKVTLICYADGSKQRSFSCTGTPDEIETEVRQMAQRERLPASIRDLVEAALMRFQKLNRD